jgi:hypothetical protein
MYSVVDYLLTYTCGPILLTAPDSWKSWPRVYLCQKLQSSEVNKSMASLYAEMGLEHYVVLITIAHRNRFWKLHAVYLGLLRTVKAFSVLSCASRVIYSKLPTNSPPLFLPGFQYTKVPGEPVG